MARPSFVRQARDGSWLVSVWVQPGARKTELVGLHGEWVKIKLRAPAVDNKANQALTENIATLLGIRPGRVAVESGHTSRQKTLRIQVQEEPDWSIFTPSDNR
ncbi:MAG: YggU family protein [Desulfovibrionales bacterium]|nr:YggU family protein [Desulfovibrionales bacterium]